MPVEFSFPSLTLRRTSVLRSETVVCVSGKTPTLVCRPSISGLRRTLRVASAADPDRTMLMIRSRFSASRRIYTVAGPGKSLPLGTIVIPLQTAALRSVWFIHSRNARRPAKLIAQTPDLLAAAGVATQVYTLETRGRPAGRLTVYSRGLHPEIEIEFFAGSPDPWLTLAAGLVLCSEMPAVG